MEVWVDATLAKTEREASRSKDVETMFAAFLSEILDIANIDPDARAISQKWKIQHAATDSAPQNGPAPAPDKSKSQQKR